MSRLFRETSRLAWSLGGLEYSLWKLDMHNEGSGPRSQSRFLLS